MKREEILCAKIGEMNDMVACFAVQFGSAEEKVRYSMTFDEVMELE